MLSRLRKALSLDYCDYPYMMRISAALLRNFSLNVDPRYTESISKIKTFLTLTAAACYFYVYLFSMLWFVFVRCFPSGDVVVGLIVFSLGVASEIGLCKLLFMFLNKQDLLLLSSMCLRIHELVDPGSRLSTNILKTLRVIKMRALIYWAVIVGNGHAYILKPLLLPGRHTFEDFFILYGLEPLLETPNYEIAFTVNTIGVLFTTYLAANTVLFQIISLGYLEAQMLAWSEELLNLWDDANKHYIKQKTTPIIGLTSGTDVEHEQSYIVNEFVAQRLKDIIKAHTKNIELHKLTAKVFRNSIFVEFLILIISLVAELLGGLENTYMQVPFALMQVGIDCFIGQRLIDSSLTFEEAVYGCKWEHFDCSNMKIVRTIMVMSNRQMTLTAGGVATLNFVSFLSIIKSIYSMYTTFRATM